MVRVERGNVVLKVEEDEIQHYLNLGYNLTDDRGRILKRSVPTQIGELQSAFVANITKIAELENTVAKLTAELELYKSTESQNTKSKRTRKNAE